MTKLAEIKPKDKPNLIDLLKAVGVDVSDWANCNTTPSRNPKYCYRWAFVEANKVVVLNLWHDHMEEINGGIVMRGINMREHANNVDEPNKKRAIEFDEAVKTAMQFKLPIRVIIGGRKKPSDEKVSSRGLDLAIWTVTAYNWKTGECTLKRGLHHFVDQFSIEEAPNQKPERREVSGLVFVRSLIVRSNALLRANGKCEWCGQLGFPTADGGIYLETHHVDPLSEGGSDTEGNVAALCPNHHREAHHGKNRTEMRKKLLERLKLRGAPGLR